MNATAEVTSVTGKAYSLTQITDYEEPPYEPTTGRVAQNEYALRRLDDKYRITEIQLRDLGREYRFDGAPADPVSNMGKVVTQTPLGASQSGHAAPMSDDLALTDYCVAQLPAIKRAVFEVNYVLCPNKPKEDRIKYLKHKRGISMSASAWDHNLQGVREIVMVLRRSVISMLKQEKT